eukprot:5149212-Pyramimonas_sp.AAC.1
MVGSNMDGEYDPFEFLDADREADDLVPTICPNPSEIRKSERDEAAGAASSFPSAPADEHLDLGR